MRYLVVSIPRSWKEISWMRDRARFDAPEGMFEAAMWISVHEQGKWTSLEQFASTSRLEFSPKTINGEEWMESAGVVSFTSISLENREANQATSMRDFMVGARVVKHAGEEI